MPQATPGDEKRENRGPSSPSGGFVTPRSGQRSPSGHSRGSSAPRNQVLPNTTVSGTQAEPTFSEAQGLYQYPRGIQYNPAVSSQDNSWTPQPPRTLPLQPRVEIPIPEVPEPWRHSPSTTTSSYSTTPVSGTELWTGSGVAPFSNFPQPYPPSSNAAEQFQPGNMFTHRLVSSPSYSSGSQMRHPDHLAVPPRAGLGASSPRGPYHHHQRGASFSSVRSSTPPLNTPSHTQTLVLPPSAFRPRLDTRAQKDTLLDSYSMPGALFPLDDISMFEASAEHNYSTDGVGYENGNLIALSLPIGNGCGFPGATLPMSLMNPLHDAVPRYLEVYWERVHPLFPVVHRASFEEAPEEVLRYAMAAVATQFLENDEDRVKGNQMHDYVAREVKRVSWTL